MKNCAEETYSVVGAANGKHSPVQNIRFLYQHKSILSSNFGQGKRLVFLRYVLIGHYKHFILYTMYYILYNKNYILCKLNYILYTLYYKIHAIYYYLYYTYYIKYTIYNIKNTIY